MKKIILNTVFLSFTLQIFCADQNNVPVDFTRQYQYQAITPQNIAKLIGTMPDDIQTKIKTFLASEPAPSKYIQPNTPSCKPNQYHLDTLLTPPNLNNLAQEIADSNLDETQELAKIIAAKKIALMNLEQNRRDSELALAIMGATNLARNNYVFTLPNHEQLVIKIASPENRLTNLIMSAGVNPYNDQQVNGRALNLKAICDRPTYQTVSTAQISLMLNDLICTKQLQHIYVPKTYLYQLPTPDQSTPNQAAEPSDNNSFVVQEFIPDLKHLYQHPEIILDQTLITPAMIQELKIAIEHAALWNLKNNLAICTDTTSPHYGKLVLFDNEQRNLTSPEEFTCITTAVYRHITGVGLKEVRELFANRHDLLAVL